MSVRHRRPLTAHAHPTISAQQLRPTRHRVQRARALGVAAVLSCVWPASLEAFEPDTPRPELAKPARMLLVRGGRLLEGDIRRGAGGYVVNVPSGNMFVPFEHVRFEADSKADAYRKLRKSMPDLTANNHIALARWCISHQQLHAAQTELSDALALEPSRQEARDMLRRLESLIHPQTARHLTLPRPARRTDDGFLANEAKSLAGLPRSLAQRYVLRIQPLLLNKCGNARCHGPESGSGLKLQHRHGVTRLNTERNLASIVQFIDLAEPDQSPLLVTPQGNHGRRGQSVFFGRSGAGQVRSIREWIREYVAHQSQVNRPVATPPQTTSTRSGSSVAAASVPVQPDAARGQLSAAQSRQPAEAINERGRQLIDKVLRDERPDAFNPAEFNQQQTGGPTRTTHRLPHPPDNPRQANNQRFPPQAPGPGGAPRIARRTLAIGHSLPTSRRVSVPIPATRDRPQPSRLNLRSAKPLLIPESLWHRRSQFNTSGNTPGGFPR